MLGELNQRFSTVDKDLMVGIQACNPRSENFLNAQDMRAIAKHYDIPLKSEEVLVALNYVRTIQKVEKPEISTTSDVYHPLEKNMFPSLKSVLQVALTIPVSSCSCERSFSSLRRLQTWLRGTMSQSRLSELAIMTIEKETLFLLDDEDIIRKFLRKSNRRQ